jgi:cytoskeletal protein RodZ
MRSGFVAFWVLGSFGQLSLLFHERFTMAISSVSSNSPSQAPPKAAPTESTETTKGGKDVKKDGDADDAGAASASSTGPVLNSLGQQIGANLNVTA